MKTATIAELLSLHHSISLLFLISKAFIWLFEKRCRWITVFMAYFRGGEEVSDLPPSRLPRTSLHCSAASLQETRVSPKSEHPSLSVRSCLGHLLFPLVACSSAIRSFVVNNGMNNLEKAFKHLSLINHKEKTQTKKIVFLCDNVAHISVFICIYEPVFGRSKQLWERAFECKSLMEEITFRQLYTQQAAFRKCIKL